MTTTNVITLRQGTTSGINLYLLADDVAINLTSAQKVIIKIRSINGILSVHDSAISTSGCVITTPASGLVTFYPYSTTYTTSITFVASESPYKLWCWVYPNTSPDMTKYSVPESNEATVYVRSDS